MKQENPHIFKKKVNELLKMRYPKKEYNELKIEGYGTKDLFKGNYSRVDKPYESKIKQLRKGFSKSAPREQSLATRLKSYKRKKEIAATTGSSKEFRNYVAEFLKNKPIKEAGLKDFGIKLKDAIKGGVNNIKDNTKSYLNRGAEKTKEQDALWKALQESKKLK